MKVEKDSKKVGKLKKEFKQGSHTELGTAIETQIRCVGDVFGE